MDEVQSQTLATGDIAEMTRQIEHRLLHVDTQMASLHVQVEHLMAEANAANGQFTVLLRHLTDPQPLQGLHERLLELAEHVESHGEQLEVLLSKLTTLADKEQLTELSSTVTRLGRTQFKANALGETKEQHIERSLHTLQELLAQREQRQEQAEQKLTAQFEDVRQAARVELAATLLPALDSVDLALASGQALVLRQRQELAAWEEARVAPSQEAAPVATGLWQKFRSKRTAPMAPSAAPPLPALLPEAVTAMPDVLESWLQGLTLLRERFLAVLAHEGIEAIEALHAPFDPRLHVAVQAEITDAVAPHTVVRVLRQGYRQQQRVLRYAEVVVARTPDDQPPMHTAPQEAHDE